MSPVLGLLALTSPAWAVCGRCDAMGAPGRREKYLVGDALL